MEIYTHSSNVQQNRYIPNTFKMNIKKYNKIQTYKIYWKQIYKPND